jgi:large subunit ribosomal protein L4e
MKINVFAKDAKATGSVELPAQFKETVRPDLIKRAVLVLQANARQPYGSFTEAGKRSSAYVSKRRHAYKSTYGIGQSRTPRKVMSYRGSRFNWKGAFAPQTVGGRRSHPPKASKQWDLKINDQERLKAIRSALAATLDKTLVVARGHKLPTTYPVALASDIESMVRTADVLALLEALGFQDDLDRASERKIRPGRGDRRGRKYRQKTSILLVTSGECALSKAARNIPGVDVVVVSALNAELLAPGATPGRLTLFTESALKRLATEKLFAGKGKSVAKAAEKAVKPAVKDVKVEKPKAAKQAVEQNAVPSKSPRKAVKKAAEVDA